MHRGELRYIRFVLVRGDGGTDPSFPKRGKESGDAVVGGGVKVAVCAVVGHEDRLQAGGVLRGKTVGGKRRRIFYVFQVFTGASGGHGERFLHVGFDAAAVAELHELCGKFMGLSQLGKCVIGTDRKIGDGIEDRAIHIEENCLIHRDSFFRGSDWKLVARG